MAFGKKDIRDGIRRIALRTRRTRNRNNRKPSVRSVRRRAVGCRKSENRARKTRLLSGEIRLRYFGCGSRSGILRLVRKIRIRPLSRSFVRKNRSGRRRPGDIVFSGNALFENSAGRKGFGPGGNRLRNVRRRGMPHIFDCGSSAPPDGARKTEAVYDRNGRGHEIALENSAKRRDGLPGKIPHENRNQAFREENLMTHERDIETGGKNDRRISV